MFGLRFPRHGAQLLAIAMAATALVGCGATTERGSEAFYREHSGEAARTAEATRALADEVAGLPAKPSAAQLEALAVEEHRTRRDLLAAAKWTVAENGEEEGVSQAEKEIYEATGALLKAMSDIRLYAQTRRPADLVGYRIEQASGREYWNQGITELWYVAHKSAPPKI
jgi:hypothetical protein